LAQRKFSLISVVIIAQIGLEQTLAQVSGREDFLSLGEIT